MKNVFLRYGMTRSKREEILLDWNELAEKYGMLIDLFYLHHFCFVFPFTFKIDNSGSSGV